MPDHNFHKPTTEEVPLVSVITVVFNGVVYLEQTIQSVINQTYENVEYIIIDGRSTDNTVKIIQKYDEQIDYWISEPDQGIYDAMNKGIKKANGKWLNFMNCGDLFNNENVLVNLKEHLIELEAPAVIGGEVLMFGENKKSKKFQPLDFTLSNLTHKGTAVVCHQAMLVTRNEVPLYDTTYRLKGELNWYFDLVQKEHFTWRYVDFVIAQYRLGGLGDISYIDFKEWVLLTYRRAGLLASIQNIPQYIRYILIRVKKIASLIISSQL